MGSYLLKVAVKPRVIEGVNVYAAKFAYKPYGREEFDAPIRARLKLDAHAEKWANKSKEARANVIVAWGNELYRVSCCWGIVSDEQLCDKPRAGKLVKRGNRYHIVWDLVKELTP